MILRLDQKEHVPLIYRYPKCKGIALVDKYLHDLTPFRKMYVIDTLEDWERVEKEFPINMMSVRCDCPSGFNPKLPHGQTFERNRVKDYIKEVKSIDKNAVIILEDMIEGRNERIHSRGGAVIDIEIGNNIKIEYVGQGFDARELCANLASHEAWSILWEKVLILDDFSKLKYRIYKVTPERYWIQRNERIKFLNKAYPNQKEEILKSIPEEYGEIKDWIFRDIVEQIIIPLYIKKEELRRNGLNSFCVEVNIANDLNEYDILVPMEIQLRKRFINIDRSNAER